MRATEDRLVTITLTETQYAGLSEIFRRAKITVDQAPLATEIMDALVTTAKVVQPDWPEEAPDKGIRLGEFHPFRGQMGETPAQPAPDEVAENADEEAEGDY